MEAERPLLVFQFDKVEVAFGDQQVGVCLARVFDERLRR